MDDKNMNAMQAKLNNSNYNPAFPQEVSDYLEAHGFRTGHGVKHPNRIYFFKNDMTIAMRGDTLDFLIFNDEEPDQRIADYSVHASFRHTASMTFTDFVLLFHITGFVPMKEFIACVKKINPDAVVELIKEFSAEHDLLTVS